jgi:magnesium transporter
MTPISAEIPRNIKAGLGPDMLVHIGDRRNTAVNMRIIRYNVPEISETVLSDYSSAEIPTAPNEVTWIDIDGIHDGAIVADIGKKFGIHMLVLEDIMNSTSRPKVEFFDEYTFITLKMLELDKTSNNLEVEQLSLVIGQNYLLMFQERQGDFFDPIRERIRTSKGKVRSKDAYYLAYLILDTVVDNYITVSDQLALQIESLEEYVLRRPNEFTLQRILRLRKELLDFKRSIDPLKEAINTMSRELDEELAKYYRDLHDHLIYESENLAMYREMIVNLLDLYHSNLGMRMNQVIKVLTIITTIFVPLTFIVGVYGMNFENMPELKTKNGYFIVLGAMALTVMFMLFYFRKKRWL